MRLIWKGALFIYRITVFGFVANIVNQLLFWAQGLKYGKGLVIKGFLSIRCEKSSSILLGDNVKINSGPFFNPIGRNQQTRLITYGDGKILIGSNVGISSMVAVSFARIQIDDKVKIGGNVVIYDSDFHSLDHNKRNSNPEDTTDVGIKEVRIKEGAFVGAHSTILKGTVIGKNSIIGAGSVVSGDVPDEQIWAGNPAVFVRNTNDR